MKLVKMVVRNLEFMFEQTLNHSVYNSVQCYNCANYLTCCY
jgi:hypothetical protein